MQEAQTRSRGSQELGCSGNLKSEQLEDVAAITDQALPEQRRDSYSGVYVRKNSK